MEMSTLAVECRFMSAISWRHLWRESINVRYFARSVIGAVPVQGARAACMLIYAVVGCIACPMPPVATLFTQTRDAGSRGVDDSRIGKVRKNG